jgi:hypothetical protein
LNTGGKEGERFPAATSGEIFVVDEHDVRLALDGPEIIGRGRNFLSLFFAPPSSRSSRAESGL